MFAYAAIFNPRHADRATMKSSADVGAAAGADLGAQQCRTRRCSMRCTSMHRPRLAVGSVFVGRAIRSLSVWKVGVSAGHTRTHLVQRRHDRLHGQLHAPNLAACAQYRFHVGDAWVDLPLWHGGYHASVKEVCGTCR